MIYVYVLVLWTAGGLAACVALSKWIDRRVVKLLLEQV